ncbi:MAG: peptidylprolyl isomerase [Candidatus Marsarchaeota archaeon]|nr:peptidylprolyl isomerase [Candidatus Marsarchaeota archaeon]MCL5413044.1 peptidylprolyl isomerase [Candidatus Marsarchaeota archaeon]
MAKSKNTHKPVLIVAAIVIIALVAVYLYATHTPTPVVASGDTVEVYYTGMFQNGTIFNSNVGQQPLQFTVGSGQVITGFNNAVEGMTLNETRNITLSPDEAYGYANPNMIISIPLSAFGNHTVSIGMTISETSGGQQLHGIITAMNSSNAIVDFNPPLAGKTLLFSIKVVGIQTK